MPDTYNPNEIAKLKHLNELARQFGIKLDGGTDPKPARDFSKATYDYNDNGTVRFKPIGDGIINLTTSQLRNKDSNFYIQFYIPTIFDAAPYINNLSSTSGLWQFTEISTQRTPPALWLLKIQTTRKAADIVTATIHFDASTNFSATDFDFAVNIT